MAKQIEADRFYEKVLEGKNQNKSVDIVHDDGSYITFEMNVLPKKKIAEHISDMPQDLFDAARDGAGAEEAEEMAEEAGTSAAIDETVVEGFENLLVDCLHHDDLSESQVRTIVEDLSFEGLFEAGADALNFSMENSGEVKGFRKQS